MTETERKTFRRVHRRRLRSALGVPAISTNKTFMANRDDGFGTDDWGRKRAYAKARAQGINPAGKVWIPQLNAWISDKSDVKRICEEKNYNCDGLVTHRAHEPENPPEKKRYEVDDKVIQREVDEIIETQQPDTTPREREKLVEETRTRMRGRQFD